MQAWDGGMKTHIREIKRRMAAVLCVSMIVGLCPAIKMNSAAARTHSGTASYSDAERESGVRATHSVSSRPSHFASDSDAEYVNSGPGVVSTQSTPSGPSKIGTPSQLLLEEIATISEATPSEYKEFEVPSLSPENVKVNLFDYWLTKQDASDTGGSNWRPDRFLQSTSINMRKPGIPHALIFAGINREKEWAFGDRYLDTNKAGPWSRSYNTYVRDNYGPKDKVDPHYSDPWPNILNRKLGQDGYPVLALTPELVESSFRYVKTNNIIRCDYEDIDPNESLAYLFDPEFEERTGEKQNGRASYENVKGLFLSRDNGMYYYNSKENAAVLGPNNKITLYNEPAVGSGSDLGQFFPFNTVEQMFRIATNSQTQKRELVSKVANGRNTPMNHYFGLTMEVEFQQPLGGRISTSTTENNDMIFTYSGDDDIWIFIDGVLVADMGGIHDAMGVTINFTDGSITYNDKDYNGEIVDVINPETKKKINTTLLAQFQAAYGDSTEYEEIFKGNTFKDWTKHTLKVFYLERGNEASNLSLSFNLMEPQPGSIVKVDQAGKPLANVAFELYRADENFKVTDPVQDRIASFTTKDKGEAALMADEDKLLLFDNDGHYVLRETGTPVGYVTSGDIHLTYKEKTGLFTVENTWETGAVAGFTAKVTSNNLQYADSESTRDPTKEGKDGLIFAVPLYKKQRTDGTKEWIPMYGSVADGFNAVLPKDQKAESIRAAVLEAVMRQALGSQDKQREYESWFLEYNENNGRFEGTMNDLPGLADEYMNNDSKGNLTLAYYVLHPSDTDDELYKAFKDCTTAEEKYRALVDVIKNASASGESENQEEDDKTIDATIKKLVEKHVDEDTRLLNTNTNSFNRYYFIRLYVPNQARILQVYKQNAKGDPLRDAEFTLYNDKACKEENAVARGKTDEKGLMTFSVQNEGGNGLGEGSKLSSAVKFALSAARTKDTGVETGPRSYWLKETKAPDGYQLKNEVVEIRVTKDSLYANAGAANDGIEVAKGVGYLLKTVARYASAAHISVTLRDIIATKYTLPADKEFDTFSIEGDNAWKEATSSQLKLHYKLDEEGSISGYDYGIHQEDADKMKDKRPYFVTDTGWVGFAVRQNYAAHQNPTDANGEPDPYYSDEAKEDLKMVDLSHLLTGSTTVMVTDPEDHTGSLTVYKTDESNADRKLQGANFILEYVLKETYEDIAGESSFDQVAGSEAGQDKISEAIRQKLETLKAEGKQIQFKQREGILTTDENGVIATSSLPEGIYRLTETKAPEGYVTDSTPIYFVINIPQESHTVAVALNVTNKRLVMPNTGGTGTGRYYLYGLSLMSIALLTERERRRRRRSAVRRN